MLLLILEIGGVRYALEAGRIEEVIPKVRAKKVPVAPHYVVGIMNYHGKPVPVIDLCALHGDTPCENRYSTRIILTRYRRESGREVLLGLVAERVTETVRVAPKDIHGGSVFVGLGLSPGNNDREDDAMVQWLDIQHTIPDSLLNDIVPDWS